MPGSWKKGLNILVIAVIIAVVAWIGYVAFLLDQGTKQSERHVFHYSIDVSYNTTIENVTLLLPVPESNGIALFGEALVNGTLYGVPPGWDLSMDAVNGTPMLAIRAEQMVPEYHGYPIAIEPRQSPLPTTLVPGTEYSPDTPVLQPVHLGVMLPVNRTIETRDPIGNEPVFAPGGQFIRREVTTRPYGGREYEHAVPVYIQYVSDRPAAVYASITIQGTNSIWKGGWLSNSYTDTITVETEDSPGWVNTTGVLMTEDGVYYR
jgi:hypothetical protein